MRKLENGDTYAIVYLKMQLLSLQNDGELVFEGIEEEFAEEIALKLDEEETTVKNAIQYLQSQGLLELNDKDEYWLPETQSLIGSETESAARTRKHRKNGSKQALHCNEDVTECNENVTKSNTNKEQCNTEIEIDIDIEKELEEEEKKEIAPSPDGENAPVIPLNPNPVNDSKNNTDTVYKKQYFENPELNAMFLDFLQIRKKMKAVNSERAINSLLKILSPYSDKGKQQIIDRSIRNSWKDVFPKEGDEKLAAHNKSSPKTMPKYGHHV